MSDRTSHRRRARQSSMDRMRAGVDFIDAALDASRVRAAEAGFIQMCEKCSRERADRRFGDLLVCGTCSKPFHGEPDMDRCG